MIIKPFTSENYKKGGLNFWPKGISLKVAGIFLDIVFFISSNQNINISAIHCLCGIWAISDVFCMFLFLTKTKVEDSKF